MNLFQLILKQIRQRSLSTVLTVISIALGVGLAIAILVLQREGKSLFGQTEFGYEVIAGVKGSGLQLVTNTVYRIDTSPGNVPWSVYERLTKEDPFRRDVKIAIPQCVGDTYEGLPIVGTTPQYFGFENDGKRSPDNKRFEYRPGQSFEVQQPGRIFDPNKFEAVIGSDVTKLTGLKLGDQFQASHGNPLEGGAADVHDEKWTVVGVLEPTHTAADKCIYIGITSFFTIEDHGDAELDRERRRIGVGALPLPEAAPAPTAAPAPAATAPTVSHDDHDTAASHDDHDDHDGDTHAGHGHHYHKHYDLKPDGTIVLHDDIMKAREVSAILIKTRGDGGGINTLRLMGNLNLVPDVMAVNPAITMRQFFETFLNAPVMLLLAIAILVTVIGALGIMTTIYNSVSARMREIAILRALGATRVRILLMISVEAAVVGLLGAVFGFLLGHGLAAIGSVFMKQTFGQAIAWYRVTDVELYYLAGVVILAFFAGLVPAMKAYRTPVSANLVAA